jgi:uncharacterized protein (TIGR02594 family)
MSKLLGRARQYLGQKEVPGPSSNPFIERVWLSLPGGKWFWETAKKDDSKVPWCGAFMAFLCKDLGVEFPVRYAAARSWAEWGEPASAASFGCVAVLVRNGGGHVAITTGQSKDGKHVKLLGGNQGDAVTEAWFPVSRVIAWRCMPGEKLAAAPVFSLGALSISEA